MVTIPTIDQISGSTVMNKMRSLINAFINFANEVDTALTVTIPEYVDDALASYYTQTEINDMLDNYYTKSEVYTKTDVYTKSEVNNLLDDALSHYYTQTQTNTLLSGKADTFILHEPLFFDTDLQDNKYIYLKRGNGITVDQVDGGKLIANIDGDTIQFDSDGKMYCAVEGATYTAGNGISISNTNVISVVNDWEVVTGLTGNLKTFIDSNYADYEFLIKEGNDEMFISVDGIHTQYVAFSCNAQSYTDDQITLYMFASNGNFRYRLDGTTFASSINPISSTHFYDSDKTTQITSSNVSTYIDSTTALKDMYYKEVSGSNVKWTPILTGDNYITVISRYGIVKYATLANCKACINGTSKNFDGNGYISWGQQAGINMSSFTVYKRKKLKTLSN